MITSIDYYFTPQSPWAYFGHARFTKMAQASKASLRVRPVDFGRVFPISGGLPLGKRAPQRQAYRLLEMQRFSEQLAVPMNLQPDFFPVQSDAAARLIIAVDLHDGASAAMQISAALFSAVWVQQRNIADAIVLAELLADVQAQYDANTDAAIAAGVFGAPSYVLDGELFWGQDRLDFVARRLNAGD
ncbi:2-hydroxychromene-2-carboxylate isomerase [Polaromonas vacuolata]|uniref:2-hydroxychromene-2-carboxylate isomerase n=1 Tax=Polaromonas vacuolata TaxID=37448 RepID=A0A6H2H504_9BURK|nr:2-hydroxychromene-2-carboxylate isomerase [Polaromonas vacuolata]QJC54883.1 2-hydroxychromene-2-carboxylate isomerase [Polaromonas vacuolata]